MTSGKAKKLKPKRKIKSGDFMLTILMMGLVVFGVIMIFSASYYSALSKTGNPYQYLIRATIWAVAGMCTFLAASALPYQVYHRFAYPAAFVALILLLLIFTPLGKDSHGAVRWLEIGPITLMPGEISKACAILFVARFLSDDPKRIRTGLGLKGIIPVAVVMVVYIVLILKQPNMSTAMTVGMIMCGMMFVAGLKAYWIPVVFGIAVSAGWYLLTMPGAEYRLQRYTSFLDPFADPLGAGYQVVQSILAMGSGGLTGVGLGQSIQKTLYLPEPQNDFIFAIIGEELGFIGCLVLMAVYLIMIWRCCHISLNAPDLFSMLLASGITIMLAGQVLLNIAVVTSCMPPTGIILPFVSYGGNALIIFMGAMGIMTNISRHSTV
ncbi:MAG: putative lipid II flippase FtsW [Firmicutes bacterium]|nr:putative lipid II flippase FtsW [Bacillota bacterium]